jgi:hypothetical protein
VNQLFNRHFCLGGEARYHLTETFSVGAEGDLLRTQGNPRGREVLLLYGKPATGVRPRHIVGGFVSYVFGQGKVVTARRWIGYWEPTIALGAGVLRNDLAVRGPEETTISSTPLYVGASLGIRFFLGTSAALHLQLHDFVFRDRIGPIDREPEGSLAAAVAGRSRELINLVLVSATLSFFLPFSSPRSSVH